MKRIFKICCILIVIVLLSVGFYFVLIPEPEGMERQKTEEMLADQYISDILNETRNLQEQNSKEVLEQDTKEANEWNDEVWYFKDGITYTPEYAKGTIQCVLEIPSVKIRRGVYGGTWEAIEHDLDIWMVTAARPDYELGKSHYCIYGHNHTVQNLSFNRLREVQIGEEFTLTSKQGQYIYQIVDIFADWRENVTKEYVDNFSLNSQECYIITCGRDENRYRDLVVKGRLTKYQTLEELKEATKKIEQITGIEKDTKIESIQKNKEEINYLYSLTWRVPIVLIILLAVCFITGKIAKKHR